MKREWTVIRSRVPKDIQAELFHYCNKEGIKPSFFVRSLIEGPLSNIVPLTKAGIHDFSFSPKEDSFSWSIKYDDGEIKSVASDLSPTFLENLLKSLQNILSLRGEYIRKRKEGSVPVPSSLKKLKGSGANVKA